jgi:hypothetical protein
MSPSRPSLFERIPPGPRAWASRLVLFAACVSVVATQQARSDDVLSPELTPAPVQLTMEAPVVTRTVTVRVSSKDRSKDAVEGELRLWMKARWTPDEATPTARPWIRVGYLQDGDTSALPSSSGILEPGAVTEVSHEFSIGSPCTVVGGCEWPVKVVFEMQSNAAPGTVDLEWTVQAAAHVIDDSSVPKGFTVTVSEP